MAPLAATFEKLLSRASHLPQDFQKYAIQLQVWADNIDDHSVRGLELRLRFSPNLLANVRSLLEDLEKALDCDFQQDPSVLVEVEDDLRIDLQGLQDLSPAIIHPAPHSRNVDEAWQEEVEKFPVSFDKRRIANRFPKAAEFLVDRLSSANAIRRARLAYARITACRGSAKRNPLSVAKSKAVTFRDSAIGTSLASSQLRIQQSLHTSDPENDSSSSDEESLASCASYETTILEEDVATRKIPAPPQEFFEDKPFECPYCYRVLKNLHSRKAWKRHVFRDIEPYSCTFKLCRQEHRTFGRRRDWIAHELFAHATVWHCPVERSHTGFANQTEVEYHVMKLHQDEISVAQLAQILPACRSTLDADKMLNECGLCHTRFSSRAALVSHLAIKFEEIALFVLPKSTGFYDDASQSQSSNSTGTLSTLSVEAAPQTAPSNTLQGVPFDDNGQTAFRKACESGDEAKVNQMLQLPTVSASDLNQPDVVGQTPLYLACKNGHEKIAKLLINHKVDINAFDIFGDTALQGALDNHQGDVVEILRQAESIAVNNKPDADAVPRYGSLDGDSAPRNPVKRRERYSYDHLFVPEPSGTLERDRKHQWKLVGGSNQRCMYCQKRVPEGSRYCNYCLLEKASEEKEAVESIEIPPMASHGISKGRRSGTPLGLLRSSVACCPCRLRNIRCSMPDGEISGRCINCIALNKECVFSPDELTTASSLLKPE